MNSVVLVGRLTFNPEIVKTENGKQVTHIVVAVNRNYKNADGIYETDFIKCTLWNGIAGAIGEYCKVGDVIGIKGRLQSSSYENQENKKVYVTDVVAERVTFLSSSAKTKDDENIKETPSKKKNK